MAQRILKLLNTMSGKFQKFNFRKFVFKKKKDRKVSQESIQYVKQKDKTTSKTGSLQRQPNWSHGDLSLPRAGAGSETPRYDASGNRYEPILGHSRGSKKGVNVRGVEFNSVLSSVEDFNQLPKRRSKTQEPKSSSAIDEPISYMDSMPRNLKEATWKTANATPFGYQKSVSSPCVGMRKTVKSSSDFDGMAIGWPSLRSWDVPGPKARFPASTVGPVHVPGSSSKVNILSTSWNNMTQGVANNTSPLSSDSRTAVTNRAKKLFALKLITGEIWNPEPTSIPYIVEQELSDNSQTVRLNSIINKHPANQNDFFRDKARKSLVDTVKKVVSTHNQPTNQGLKRRVQSNLERDKLNFSKHIRAPTVGTSRDYSETNNLYLAKIKNSEQKVPRYRANAQQLVNALKVSKVPDNTAPTLTKVPNFKGVDKGATVKKISNASGPNPLKAVKIEQKNLAKSSDSKPTILEKGPHHEPWHIKKVSDFVWQKLKKMSDFASSNLKQVSVTGENLGKNVTFGKQNTKKVSDVAGQNLRKVPDVTSSNLKQVQDLRLPELKNVSEFANNLKQVQDLGRPELENVSQFARPIPRHVFELVNANQKSVPDFARPLPKNISDPVKMTMKKIPKFSDPNFEKEQGYAWSHLNKLSKFSDPNLKKVEITETTIRKFPYFEVVNIRKEYDFQLPHFKKGSNLVIPNSSNQVGLSETILTKESEFVETDSKITPDLPEQTPDLDKDSAGTKVKKGFEFADLSEPVPAKAAGPTAVSNHETVLNQEEPNIRTPDLAESKDEQVHTLVQAKVGKVPKFSEPKLEKRSEFARQILNTSPKIERLTDPQETNAVQEPDLSESNLKKEAELESQNTENMSQLPVPNLSKGYEFTRNKIRKVSATAESQCRKTPDLDVPELDQLNLKKLPKVLHPIKQAAPNSNINKASEISSTSKVGVLNQFSSVISDKETNSILNTLQDTTTKITNNVTDGPLNIISNDSGKIEKTPPDSRSQDLQTPWKIYVIHNAQGKSSNPVSSQQQKTSGSFTGTETPSKPANYSPESQSSKTWKKMSRSSHNPPSTSNGCTETLMTTRKFKSANLQNYPPPQMFNQMERGENKFLVFWKGREDTNIFSHSNKKESILMQPQSPRRNPSPGGVNSQKSVAECQTDDESLSRYVMVSNS